MSQLDQVTTLILLSYRMVHDKKIIGACGETELANPKQSLITMMQVSEGRYLHFIHVQFGADFEMLAGLRVLYFPSPYEVIRVSLWIDYLLARVFHHLSTPCPGYAQAFIRLSADRGRIPGKSSRYTAHEESAPPGRGPISHNPHSQTFPWTQDKVCARRSCLHCGSGRLEGPAIAA